MGTTRTKKRSRRRRSRRGNIATIGMLVAGVVLVGAVATILITSGGTRTTAANDSGAGAVAASALTQTGEVNEMGLPVLETPGYASGIAEIGGITVQGSDWAMGQVPLDVAVRPFWTLTNTGSTTVALGRPQAQVREGCCPGPLVLGATTLAPGASTVLTFELAMHEGMDGWHDMGVFVPVGGEDGDQWLELNVTGDFRN